MYICNVIYLVGCSNCREQYIGSAIDLKQRFKIHKSDIKTNKDRCGTAKHFNGKVFREFLKFIKVFGLKMFFF